MPIKTPTRNLSVLWQSKKPSPKVNVRQMPSAVDIIDEVDMVDTEEDILVVVGDVSMVVIISIVPRRLFLWYLWRRAACQWTTTSCRCCSLHYRKFYTAAFWTEWYWLSEHVSMLVHKGYSTICRSSPMRIMLLNWGMSRGHIFARTPTANAIIE